MQGVQWWMEGDYLHASCDVGAYRVKVPGAAVMDQAVNLITWRIKSKRYAAKH